MFKNNYSDRELKAMFGKVILPTIPIALGEISQKAQAMAGQLSISGVQPKLSMRLENGQLLSVTRDGRYILKPQTQLFADMPQNEYLCMKMGQAFGLTIAPCLLMELSDGSLAYLVKRFDRFQKGRRVAKLACEDMQQILGGDDKYAGSHEQIAAAIETHCRFGPLELQRLFERTIFNFAIGNGDAHRKNFSLLTDATGLVALSPAYDLVSSRLVIPGEDVELALTLNGKRNRLGRDDFLAFAKHLGIDASYAEGRIAALCARRDAFLDRIEHSRLPPESRRRFQDILSTRLARM